MTVSKVDSKRIDCIVIGTSAGGIEALSVLLPALSVEMNIPIVIVLHLPRDQPSALVELFSSKCALPVYEANEKERIKPATVYFAPPDYHLLIEGGPRFALSADDPVNFSRPSIDVLFESAVDIYGEHLMGIVLTGASEDGGKGLAAIQQGGGITIVQEPKTAYSPFMAESALKRLSPDFVLSLEDIAQIMRRSRSVNRPSPNGRIKEIQ